MRLALLPNRASTRQPTTAPGASAFSATGGTLDQPRLREELLRNRSVRQQGFLRRSLHRRHARIKGQAADRLSLIRSTSESSGSSCSIAKQERHRPTAWPARRGARRRRARSRSVASKTVPIAPSRGRPTSSAILDCSVPPTYDDRTHPRPSSLGFERQIGGVFSI